MAFDLSQSDPGRIIIIFISSCIESIQINFFFGGEWANGKKKGMDYGLPVAVRPLVNMCTCTPRENKSLSL